MTDAPRKSGRYVNFNVLEWRELESRIAPHDRDWALAMMTRYVLAANWTGEKTLTNNGLARGQLIAPSSKEEGAQRGVSLQRIQRRRSKLRALELITTTTNNHETTITVNNYAALTRVPSRSTDSGHFSQRNGDPEPERDQPNASAINQNGSSRSTDSGHFSQRNSSSEVERDQPNSATANTGTRSTTANGDTRTSEPDTGSDSPDVDAIDAQLSEWDHADEVISLLVEYGWTDSPSNRQRLLEAILSYDGVGAEGILWKLQDIACRNTSKDNRNLMYDVIANPAKYAIEIRECSYDIVDGDADDYRPPSRPVGITTTDDDLPF
jgi:hypothetical protein